MKSALASSREPVAQKRAFRAGKNTAQVVEEAVDRMLEYDVRFLEAVEEGRAAACRGDLLEHDPLVESIERILHS
jgi:hypothetical protein